MRYWYLSYSHKIIIINVHMQLSSVARGLSFGQSLQVHLLPYFEYASSEGSGKTVYFLGPDKEIL